MKSYERSLLEEKLRDAGQRLNKAQAQIEVLDKQIRELEVLYKRAQKTKKHSFRYNLRLRLSAITGIKMMYHHYKSTKEEEINEIRAKLYGEEFDQVNSRRNEPI